jgi:hypothetical protein
MEQEASENIVPIEIVENEMKEDETTETEMEVQPETNDVPTQQDVVENSLEEPIVESADSVAPEVEDANPENVLSSQEPVVPEDGENIEFVPLKEDQQNEDSEIPQNIDVSTPPAEEVTENNEENQIVEVPLQSSSSVKLISKSSDYLNNKKSKSTLDLLRFNASTDQLSNNRDLTESRDILPWMMSNNALDIGQSLEIVKTSGSEANIHDLVFNLSRDMTQPVKDSAEEAEELSQLIRVNSNYVAPEEIKKSAVSMNKLTISTPELPTGKTDEKPKTIINREALLTKFNTLLEKRDRVKTRNQFLQHKLAEYFKRKRVHYILLIDISQMRTKILRKCLQIGSSVMLPVSTHFPICVVN